MKGLPKKILRDIDSGRTSLPDATQLLRLGSALDKFQLTTCCKTCGAKAAKPLRWFLKVDYRCSCGGAFDTEPLAELLKRADSGDLAPVKGISFMPDLKGKSGREN